MHFGNVIFAATCGFCALIFIAMAVWAFKRKTPMHFWSGSTVTPEEITDIPAYNRANGVMWAAYAAGMAMAGAAGLFSVNAGVVLLLIVCLPGIAVLIIAYKRIYNRYRNPSFMSSSKPLGSKTSKAVVIFAVASTACVLIAVGILFYHGDKEPEVNILSDGVQIKAMYGLLIPVSDIKGVSLIRESMSDIGVGIKTNGYNGFGQSLKGHFHSEKTGPTLLFVQAKSSPTIRIERTDKKDIYISFRAGEETERLYRELRRRI